MLVVRANLDRRGKGVLLLLLLFFHHTYGESLTNLTTVYGVYVRVREPNLPNFRVSRDGHVSGTIASTGRSRFKVIGFNRTKTKKKSVKKIFFYDRIYDICVFYDR